MDPRLVGIHIEAGGTEMPELEGYRERLFAHQVAPRGVDQNRASLHARQRVRIDDAFRFRTRWHVQAHDVALPEEPAGLDAHRTSLALEFRLECSRRVQDPEPNAMARR